MPVRPSRRLMALLTIVATVFASFLISIATAPSASATHYRANQMSWHKGAGTNEAEFHVGGSWRCTFFFNPCNPTVGQTFRAGNLNFGDGSPAQAGVVFEVVSFDAANDVVTAEAHITHTYASAGPFTAFISDCCRLSRSGGHINNPDGSSRYETVVDFARTSASPVALVAPIVDCPINAVCRFTVPAADPDGQGLAWRLSTAAEAAGGSFTQPPGATIDSASGLYSWDTTGATLAPSGSTFYSTQVMVENVVGGNVISRTAVDFFIRLGSNSANQQPVFDAPTPADGAIITATVGTPLTVNVAASDPDAADSVVTNVLGLPTGSTYTPTNGNPASGVLTWTPTAPGDYPVTFTAQDQLGLGAIPRGAIIRVAAGNPAPTVDAGADVDGTVGEPANLDGTIGASGPVTSTWTATPGADVEPGATCQFGDAAQVDTTVTCSGQGTWTLTLTADDGTNPAVSDTATLTVARALLPAEIQCRTAKAQGPGTTVDGRKVVLGTGGSGHQIVLSNDSGNMTLSGGSGNDLLCAWGGNNVLDGGSGHDTLVVMSGSNNKLIGGSGDDTMIGFAADTFVDNTGNNTITKK